MVEKYKSSKSLLLYTAIALTVITLSGNVNNESFSASNLVVDFGWIVSLLLAVHILTEYIYITIDPKGKIYNSGYRTFGKDEIDISQVCCIYRLPQFDFSWFGGSLMLIYSRNDKGLLTYSALREYAYNESTLRKFLVRVKEVNSSIELDPEYEEFLHNKRKLHTASSNTVQKLKQKLEKQLWNH